MSLGLQIMIYATGIVIAIAVLIALFRTNRPVRSLLGSGVQGVCALAAVNVAGAFTGISLGLNLFSGLCCVVLGIPGVIALLILKLIMNV